MAEEKEKTTPTSAGTPEVKKAAVVHRKLTVSQKAEAVALWRAGKVTLDDLAKKFKKRPEAFSRLFKKMGIEKGSAVAEEVKKKAEIIEAAAVDELSETLKKLAATKDRYYQINDGLAMIAWGEIVRARKASLPIAQLRETMQTLKLASDVIGNARKEIYDILDVEEVKKGKELEELPELTVRELTQQQIEELQSSGTVDDLDEMPTLPDDDDSLDGGL